MGGAGKGPGRNQRRIEADQGEAGTGSEKAGNENSERERCGNAEAPPKRQRNGGWKTGQNRAEQTEQNKPKRPERSNRSNNLRKKFVSCRKQRRPNMELSDKKFAVLIDADNISHRKIKDILDEIANYGTPTIKRIYGLHRSEIRGMEKHSAGELDHPDSAVCLHHRQERNGFGADNRRDGHPAQGVGQRLLHRIE